MTGSILLRNGRLSDVLGELQVGRIFPHFYVQILLDTLSRGSAYASALFIVFALLNFVSRFVNDVAMGSKSINFVHV